MISHISSLSDEDKLDTETILQHLTQGKVEFNLPTDFLHFVALSALFPPSRNILKNWQLSEPVFLSLVKKEGKIGIDHFMQSVVLYFVRRHRDDLSKFAPTFMKKLVDEDILTEKFLLEWFDKTTRLDKESLLYDKKAEKHFRDMIEQFIEWLR